MENIKKGIVILLIVFVVMFGVLFGMNSATQDIIAGNVENWALNEVRALNLFPAGTDFERVQAGLPAGVTGVFRTKNNAGFIIYTSVPAYGPGPMTIATAIGTNGRIIDTRVLENSETPSFLGKVQDGVQPQFKGIDKDGLDGVDTVATATITSEAFIAAVRIAFDAFDRVRR